MHLASADRATIHSTNPADERVLASYDLMTTDEVGRRLNRSVEAQNQWARTKVAERTSLLRRIAVLLRARAAEFGGLITAEMGKPIAEAEAEVVKCAWCCEYYAENAEGFLATETIETNATESFVVLEPLGVVLAVMPWNFPFWQFFRFAAPALACGNGAILKHASNVPQCAAAIEAVLLDAGMPYGLIANLFVPASDVAGLIDDPRIAAVTLTGSTEVGRIVAAHAGRAMKKQVLELGGSDPFIVLADADIEAAAAAAVKARFTNTGQSCVCAKRFVVETTVADRFVEAMLAGIAKLVVGDPTDRSVQVGPMARDNLRRDLLDQVRRSVEAGAELRVGGGPIEGPGFFFAPTLLDRVTPGMAAFDEETFGPVAAVVRASDVDQAIALANQTEFGLGAALWTGSIQTAKSLVPRIQAGAVFVNGMVASDPRLPFGGIKQSGYGRELGIHGLREFANVKTVWIGPATSPVPPPAPVVD